MAVLLLAQIALVLFLSDLLRQRMAMAYTVLELLALAYAFRINSRPGGSSYKLGWTLLILTVPVVGLILYWLWNGDHPQKRLDLKKLPRPQESEARREASRLQVEKLRREHPEWGRLAAYLDRQGFPLYTGTGAVYLPTGEAYLEDMLERMEQAEHFIFMEFYIMAEGQLWDRLMDIFRRKAGQGVEIKVLFDDFGSMMRMSEEAVEELRRIGAEVLIFNPVHHYVNRLYFNYRDHRKIACIDGDTAYTGGANIADEYANLMERFGYWKDDGIRLEGQACLDSDPGVHLYVGAHGRRPCSRSTTITGPTSSAAGQGFVQPIADGPDSNPVSSAEDAFLQLIGGAKHMVYITSPYLAIDESMEKALCMAAGSGVDVRLMMPGDPGPQIRLHGGGELFRGAAGPRREDLSVHPGAAARENRSGGPGGGLCGVREHGLPQLPAALRVRHPAVRRAGPGDPAGGHGRHYGKVPAGDPVRLGAPPPAAPGAGRPAAALRHVDVNIKKSRAFFDKELQSAARIICSP